MSDGNAGGRAGRNLFALFEAAAAAAAHPDRPLLIVPIFYTRLPTEGTP